MTVFIATRGSALALAQAGALAAELSSIMRRPVELLPITTHGDVNSAPLEVIGGTGVFVGAVRAALNAGQAQLAVHSLKDLPTAPDPSLWLVAIPRRADPRDALCARDRLKLADLPTGASVGTGSPRRRALLLNARADLNVVELRGNVDTRLGRVTSGDLDAVVLAQAGLARLGRADSATQLLSPTDFLPAPGQGALAVECRSDETDLELLAALAQLDDAETRAAVLAERSVLATLEAGCSAPVGAYASTHGFGSERPELNLHAAVLGVGAVVRKSIVGPADEPEVLGARLAAELVASGAAELLGERVP
ncbi:MAG: hydroxymethylbilane synthase [Actinomycetes bacterium]